MVIAVCSLKGGTGKSTVALNLAGILSTRKRKVLLIDADPQGSIAKWQEDSEQEDPTILVEPQAVIHENIDKVRDQFDLVIIDAPPFRGEQVFSILNAADCWLIPVVPGITDVWSTRQMIQAYQLEKERRPEFEARLLISRVDRRTRLGREFRGYLQRMGVPVFKTEIAQRVAVGEAWLAGLTIDRYDPTSPSADDFKRLAQEVLQWVKLKG